MPCNLYGINDNYHPVNSHVLPALIRKFHEAKINNLKSVTCWGDGSPLREFLFVDDLAEACVFLMNNYSGSETVRRARAKIGERRYNLLGHNCEHFAVECKTGRSESSQTEIFDAGSIMKGILSEAEELFSF